MAPSRKFGVRVATGRCAIGAILIAFTAIAQAEEDPFTKWAAAHAITVTTLESAGDFADLEPLKALVGTSRVVAIGEPTHGAHEPMAFRNRLIRFLIEQMGFTAVALESGFTESRSVNEFIGGGPGDARDITRSGLTSGFGRYAENRELIQWMRDHNATRTSTRHEPVHFYGVDLTAGGRISGPMRALDSALAYLSAVDAADAARIRRSTSAVLPRSDDDRFDALAAPARLQFKASLREVAGAITRHRTSLLARSSAEEYRWSLQNLEAARALVKFFEVSVPPSQDVGMRRAGPAIVVRDQAMARNVRWAVEQEGPKGGLIVFAHDNHVMNWTQDGGIWANIREKPPMMGAYLRRLYGKNLLIIATSAAGASAALPRFEPIPDSIDSALARVGMPAMLLDLRSARQDAAALAWLSVQRPLHANISTHVLVTPLRATDAFFFVNTLTPAQPNQ